MKTNKLWLALAALAVLAIASTAKAANPQNLDIRVSINATKDLTVDSTYYTFAAIPVSSEAVSASSITVTNSSTGLIQTYTLQGADAYTLTADTWTLSDVGIGANTYMMGAIFHNATPALGDFGSEDNLNSSTALVANATVLSNGGETGASVASGAARHLWFMIFTPSSVADPSTHKATIVLAVQ
jgi:hypothetical protein